MPLDEKSRDPVVGVWHDFAADGENAHLQALLVFGGAHVGRPHALGHLIHDAQANLLRGFGVQRHRAPERGCGSLPGMVIRGRANAAATEDDVARGKTATQGLGERLAVIG